MQQSAYMSPDACRLGLGRAVLPMSADAGPAARFDSPSTIRTNRCDPLLRRLFHAGGQPGESWSPHPLATSRCLWFPPRSGTQLARALSALVLITTVTCVVLDKGEAMKYLLLHGSATPHTGDPRCRRRTDGRGTERACLGASPLRGSQPWIRYGVPAVGTPRKGRHCYQFLGGSAATRPPASPLL
jgi:hypothetical protein